jgi:hypothetical protein
MGVLAPHVQCETGPASLLASTGGAVPSMAPPASPPEDELCEEPELPLEPLQPPELDVPPPELPPPELLPLEP